MKNTYIIYNFCFLLLNLLFMALFFSNALNEMFVENKYMHNISKKHFNKALIGQNYKKIESEFGSDWVQKIPSLIIAKEIEFSFTLEYSNGMQSITLDFFNNNLLIYQQNKVVFEECLDLNEIHFFIELIGKSDLLKISEDTIAAKNFFASQFKTLEHFAGGMDGPWFSYKLKLGKFENSFYCSYAPPIKLENLSNSDDNITIYDYAEMEVFRFVKNKVRIWLKDKSPNIIFR